MPGLDGLRALAVIAALVYHGNSSLLPALFLIILASLTVAVLFLPDEVAALRNDALAAAAYVTNWYFVASQQSYFEAVGRPSLLKHLWSLAIEEQFYVLWPIFLSLMLRRLRLPWVQILILAMAAASAVLMALFYVPNSDPSRVYYGTDTRAAGLLCGASLAFVYAPELLPRRFDKSPFDLIGLGALAVLAWFCLSINQFQASLYREDSPWSASPPLCSSPPPSTPGRGSARSCWAASRYVGSACAPMASISGIGRCSCSRARNWMCRLTVCRSLLCA